jgi:hypothetical protein
MHYELRDKKNPYASLAIVLYCNMNLRDMQVKSIYLLHNNVYFGTDRNYMQYRPKLSK